MKCSCKTCSWYVNDPPSHDVAIDTQGGVRLFFTNNSVPRMMVLYSTPDEKLSPEVTAQIEAYLRRPRNFKHMILPYQGGISYSSRGMKT